MNKQNYYLLGGALLASTALTTGAQAAVIKNAPATLVGGSQTATSYTASVLASQVFSSNASTASQVTITPGATSSAAGSILIDFGSALTASFNVQINVTNAAFTGTPSVVFYHQSTNGTLTSMVAGATCGVQPLSDKLLLTACTAATGAASSADAAIVYGLSYSGAGALATAGTSIKLDGWVTQNGGGNVTFETITSANVVTSKNAAEASVQAATALNIDNTATPVFSKFSSGARSAALGSIHFSVTGSVGTDLASTFSTVGSITGTAEVKVTSSLLSDPALTSIWISTSGFATAAQFVSGTVSFQVPAASLAASIINVAVDGTTGILATTGTSTAIVTPTTTTGIITAIAPFSGNLASLSRGGLSVELNTVMPTAGEGSTKYRSVIRIANISSVDSVAIITVKNDSTGVAIGTYTTTTIKAGGTLQLTSADLEANVSGAAAAGANYKVVVSGSFNGYVQNMIWNSVTGIFSDISGFRNGSLTLDP